MNKKLWMTVDHSNRKIMYDPSGRMRSFFRKEDGYDIYYNCPACGKWTLGDYCNKGCMRLVLQKNYPVNIYPVQLGAPLRKVIYNHIIKTLEFLDGDISRTAKALNIMRRTIYNYFERYGR